MSLPVKAYRGIAEGLTCYAIERQAGFERHQMPGMPRQPETRNRWIRNILRDAAEITRVEQPLEDVVDTALDLQITRIAGDRFLEQSMVTWSGGPYTLAVPAMKEIQQGGMTFG